ncbi:unnamed protein product [Urochloa decumbens]|uniref:Uncharacterized protein n=1 Tax=Urochloa decumbens TaxID=240449 RepID=A0ABC9E860_9POAL
MGILSCGAAATLYYTNRIASLGWLGLVLGVLSSYCRRESTDFEEFSWTLFLTSMGLTVAGFLWLYHPNLCVARQYKITSYLLSGARAIQVLKWLSPKIRVGMRRMEGREEAKAEQSRLVLLRHPRRRMRTPIISLIRFGWNTRR